MLYSIIFSNQYTPEEAIIMLLISIFVFFISLTLHELAHGIVAYKMGDPTPKVQGRLTLNPFKHLDTMGFLCFILFGFGWAKPIDYNPMNFKKYKKGMRLVSIAGILTNVFLGLIGAGIYAILFSTVGLPNEAMMYVYMLLASFMTVNSFLALFNVLPIFPLDGFNFVKTFIRGENKFTNFNYRYGNKLIWGIILGSVIIELMFNFDVFGWYLSLLNNYVFTPIALLGV